MPDIFDYLKQYGNSGMSREIFNEVDALVLSRLSYLPFDGIVSENALKKITLGEAAGIFFASEDLAAKISMTKDIDLLRLLKNSDRFKDMLLSGFVNETDYETQKQFAALLIDTGDGAHFISFRGTDNTLLGWKEDFNMSFMTPVPAQTAAVAYLESVSSAATGNLRTGGHSKGGNLAVYAAAFCTEAVQNRIKEIYNNDGPGFETNVIYSAGYNKISERIRTFVPQSSVVGMLLWQEGQYTIVKSTQRGLLQHDLYSWEVDGTRFEVLDKVTGKSKFIDRTLKDWMARVEPKQREQFIDAIYEILSQTEAKTVKELSVGWYKNALTILKSFKNMDAPTKYFISKTMFLLLKSAKQNWSLLKETSSSPVLLSAETDDSPPQI